MNYCLGTVQFGMNYGIQSNGRPDLGSVYKILDEAILNGVTHFDTAIAYGNAEIILGKYISSKGINKNSIRVITKDKSQTDLDSLCKNIIQSIERLCIDKLYGFLFHDSSVVNSKELMSLLFDIKKKGLSEKVGVSIYTPDEALKALEYDIDIIQVPYNLFDNRLDKVNFFKRSKDKKVEIYARSSLLQGLVLMDCDRLPNNVLFAKPYLHEFDKLCKKYDINRLEAAVGYVSSNKYIDYIVFGTDNMKQFTEYLAIRDIVLPSFFIDEIRKAFNDIPEKLVNPILWK